MKLHRLELEGFGPFRARQAVDFDAFDADGLFLISGRTGAGKSSVLDGVCYALYGTAPRYDGGDRGLRSDHAEPEEATSARLEFTAADERWRVTRTPEYERPKARGIGTTIQKSTVLVEQLVDEQWHGRATKYREAAELLDEILGLTRDQFQQVILLAQNRFAEFLLAGNDERQALLRTLFGTRRYEDYEKEFDRRRREARAALEGGSAALEAHLAHAEGLARDNALDSTVAGSSRVEGEHPASDSPLLSTPTAAERVDAVGRAAPRAQYRADESIRRADEARVAHDAALAAYGEQSALRKRQEQRAASRLSLAELEERAPDIAVERTRLAQAAAADALRTSLAAAERAAAIADRARHAESDARETWNAVDAPPQVDADADALTAFAESLAGDLAVWAAAADQEQALPALAAAVTDADAAIVLLDAEAARARDADADRTLRLAALEPQIDELESTAPPAVPANEALASAVVHLEAGREAARLEPMAQAADAAHLAAVDELEQCSAALRSLLERRLDGYAGELAGALVDGEPCPVCGAREHPHPAQASGEPVTDDMLADAEARVAAATAAATKASVDAREARASYQDARARAGGISLDRLEARHHDAQALVKAADEAATALAALKDDLRALRTADAEAAESRTTLAAQLAAAKEERAAHVERHAAAEEAVAAARGAHASVADRIDEASRVRDAARALAGAMEESTRAEVAASDTRRELAEHLADSPFDDAEGARTALLGAEERETLAAEIHRYDVDVATERERLLALETELAGTPDELIDLTPAAEAASAAREAWNLAVTTAARDSEVATQLAEAVERATRAHATSAEREAEHEIIAGLADALSGRNDTRMDLETFVLAAELEQIVDAANLRLDAMSSGRYRLAHSDAVGRHRAASGLGLAVFDSYTGQSRPAASLSGGETFLASLALALGLAEVVTARSGGVRLDTLFIDEGFGSLDDETLELAMRTLDELRQGGRTVGLISHVASMKEQLPAQLLVEATPQGPSVIRQETTARMG